MEEKGVARLTMVLGCFLYRVTSRESGLVTISLKARARFSFFVTEGGERGWRGKRPRVLLRFFIHRWQIVHRSASRVVAASGTGKKSKLRGITKESISRLHQPISYRSTRRNCHPTSTRVWFHLEFQRRMKFMRECFLKMLFHFIIIILLVYPLYYIYISFLLLLYFMFYILWYLASCKSLVH